MGSCLVVGAGGVPRLGGLGTRARCAFLCLQDGGETGPGQGRQVQLPSGSGSPACPGLDSHWEMIVGALASPAPWPPCSPSLPPRDGRREVWAARLMEESDAHPPPGPPTEAEWLKANAQGQSINGGTGSPSLPGPHAQRGVLGPVCKRRGPGTDSKTYLSDAPANVDVRSPGLRVSLLLTHTQTHTHTPAYTHTPKHPHPRNHTHTQTHQSDQGLDPSSCAPASQPDVTSGFCPQGHSLANLRLILHRESQSHFPNVWHLICRIRNCCSSRGYFA